MKFKETIKIAEIIKIMRMIKTVLMHVSTTTRLV